MVKLIKNESGIALFLVLWVLVLLAVITAEFCYVMRTETRIAYNFTASTKAYYIAEAGLSKAIFEVVRHKLAPNLTDRLNNETNLWRINLDPVKIPFADGYYLVKVMNEAGKINLNYMTQAHYDIFFNRLPIKKKDRFIIRDSIIDWRDEDSLHRGYGAESNYYHKLPSPYDCKNSLFQSKNELLLVRGITYPIFKKYLEPIVTAYYDPITIETLRFANPKKRKELLHSLFDYSQINVNAASKEVLMTFPEMTYEKVDKIQKFRKKKDFTALIEFQRIVGNETYRLINSYVTLKTSPFYTITATGYVDQNTKAPIYHKIQVTIKIDRTLAKGYKILEKNDHFL